MQIPSEASKSSGNSSTGLPSLQSAIDSAMARGFIYRYLAMAFEYPSAEQWLWLSDAQVKRSFAGAVSFATSDGAMPGLAQTMLGAFVTENYKAHVDDYVALFGHAARGSCPLNEIEYGDLKADPLFQPHRLADLAAFYRAFGLEVGPDAKERQDHICIELEFMSVLAVKEAFAVENQVDEEQFAACRDAQRKFLREHLGRWTPAFCRRLGGWAGADGAASLPMGALAAFTQQFVIDECRRHGIAAGSEDLLLRPTDESESLCASCGITNLPPGALATT